jgi:MOSC domain-containing protein YiiM
MASYLSGGAHSKAKLARESAGVMLKGTIQQINLKPLTPGEHGLPKRPVDSAFVSQGGVRGDYNIYRHEKRKDDPDMALLLMPIEMIRELNSEGWPVRPGDLGENLTTSGLSYSYFEIGKVLSVGEMRLQISKACDPCNNLFLLPYIGKAKGPAFVNTMLGRRGWYARVLKEGWVRAGDEISEAAV